MFVGSTRKDVTSVRYNLQWDKPKEFALYEEQLNKQNPCIQNHPRSPILSPLNVTKPLDDEEQKTVRGTQT